MGWSWVRMKLKACRISDEGRLLTARVVSQGRGGFVASAYWVIQVLHFTIYCNGRGWWGGGVNLHNYTPYLSHRLTSIINDCCRWCVLTITKPERNIPIEFDFTQSAKEPSLWRQQLSRQPMPQRNGCSILSGNRDIAWCQILLAEQICW